MFRILWIKRWGIRGRASMRGEEKKMNFLTHNNSSLNYQNALYGECVHTGGMSKHAPCVYVLTCLFRKLNGQILRYCFTKLKHPLCLFCPNPCSELLIYSFQITKWRFPKSCQRNIYKTPLYMFPPPRVLSSGCFRPRGLHHGGADGLRVGLVARLAGLPQLRLERLHLRVEV